MKPKRVLTIHAPSFALLVKRLKLDLKKADAFEIDLDCMRVKGDLAVIQSHFKKPLIACASSLDLLKRAVTANLPYLILPHDLDLDQEFTTLLKNKGAEIIERDDPRFEWLV